MSAEDASDSTSPSSQEPESWPVLASIERRILGVLVEKQKTSKTSDSYPLTLNALVTGCNQKSNRDPVLDLDEVEVEEGLTGLQNKGLVERLTGGRAERFRHRLYDLWTRNGPELAVLAELLLRGPQTRGDLRGRAGRMDAIDTLDALDGILQPLAARRLVIFLTDPERRGALVTHGFHEPGELARLKEGAPAPLDREPVRSAPSAPAGSIETRFAALVAEIDSLKDRTLVLENELTALKSQLGPPAGG